MTTVTTRETVQLTAASSKKKGEIVTLLVGGRELTGRLTTDPTGAYLETASDGKLRVGGTTSLLEFVLGRDRYGRPVDRDGNLVDAEDIAAENARQLSRFQDAVARKLSAANDSVATLRQMLIDEVAKAERADSLGGTVNEIASAEGRRDFWQRLAAAGEDLTPEVAREIAFDTLSYGADDSWSGRGNDVRRARFDGMRAAASDLKWLI